MDKSNNEKDNSNCFVEVLSEKNLNEIPMDIFNKTLKSIDLSCNNISIIKDNDFKNCPGLKQLKLYSNKLKKINGMNSLYKLEELQLQYNLIKSLGKSLKHLQSLKTLRLDSNKIQQISIQDVCILNNLTYLDVSSNGIENINFINVLTSLQQFICTHNRITKVDNIHTLKYLEEIDLSFNAIDDISGIKNLSKLKSLKVQDNKLQSLSNVGTMKSIQELLVDNNCISDVKHITKQFVNVVILHISGNDIIDINNLDHLVDLKSSLRELSIHHNPVTINNGKEIIMELLLQLDLELFDSISQKVPAKRSLTPCLMRPMSANQIVSTRCIEEQFRTSEICMDDYVERISSQFAVLNVMLTELPDKACLEEARSLSRLSQTSCCSLLSEKRPTSKCSRRVHIEDAKAFAEENFT